MHSFLGALLAAGLLLVSIDAGENRLHRHAAKRLDSRALVPMEHYTLAAPVNKLYLMIEGGANVPLFPTPCTGLVLCLSATFSGKLQGTLKPGNPSTLEIEGSASATVSVDALAVFHVTAGIEGSFSIEASCASYTRSGNEPLPADQEFGWSAMSSFLTQLVGSDEDILAFGQLDAAHQKAWKDAGDEAICAKEALAYAEKVQKTAKAKGKGLRRLLGAASVTTADALAAMSEEELKTMSGMEIYHLLADDEKAQILAKVTAGMTERDVIVKRIKALEVTLRKMYYDFLTEVEVDWDNIFGTTVNPFEDWEMTAAEDKALDKQYARDDWIKHVMGAFGDKMLQPERAIQLKTWLKDPKRKNLTPKTNNINCEPGALNFGSGSAGTSVNIMMCRFMKTAFLKSTSATGVDLKTFTDGFTSMFPMLTHKDPSMVSIAMETKDISDKFSLLYQCPEEFKKGLAEYQKAATDEVTRDQCWVSKFTGRVKLSFGFSIGFSSLPSISVSAGVFAQIEMVRPSKNKKFTIGDESGAFAVLGASSSFLGLSFSYENQWKLMPKKFQHSTLTFCQDCSRTFDNKKVTSQGATLAAKTKDSLDALLREDLLGVNCGGVENCETKVWAGAGKFYEWFYSKEGVAFHHSLGLDKCYPVEPPNKSKYEAIKKFAKGKFDVSAVATLVQDISAVYLEATNGLGDTPFASVKYSGKHCVEFKLGATAAASELAVSLTKRIDVGGGKGLMQQVTEGSPGDTLGYFGIEQGSIYEF